MSEPEWHRIGLVADFKLGSLHPMRIGSYRLCIGKGDTGHFAVDDTCPHAGGSLSTGLLDGREIICPLHAWGFDVETGETPDDPFCPLRVYPVRARGDDLEVLLPAPA